MSGARLSLVVATDRWSTIRSTVLHQARRAAEGWELVVVAEDVPSIEEQRPRLERAFSTVRVVPVERALPLAESRAAGVRAASAERVFIGESHSYPDPGALDVLAEAVEGEVVGATPSFLNLNAGRFASRGNFLADYGQWPPDGERGVEAHHPVYNGVFRRSTLLEWGDRLSSAVGQGDAMHEGLRERGLRVVFEPRAVVRHLNLDRPVASLRDRFLLGRVIADGRRRRWSRPRSLAYALAWPLAAVVLARRQLSRMRGRVPFPLASWICAMAVVRTSGEALGYVFGCADRQRDECDGYELYKAAIVAGKPI